MTWTYQTSLATTRDQIRLLVGDTDQADPLIQDEEIAFLVTGESGLYRQAAAVADAIAAKFARDVDRLMGTGIQTQSEFRNSQKYTQFTAKAKSLRAQAGRRQGVPTAGGVSQSTKAAVADDTDRVQPLFGRCLPEGAGRVP